MNLFLKLNYKMWWDENEFNKYNEKVLNKVLKRRNLESIDI